METERRDLTPGGRAAWWGNRLINRLLVVCLVVIFLFAAYALYDVWRVLHGADSSRLDPYKPDGGLGLEELMESNPDVCAWIILDETHIDYPVVRGKDNEEYLEKDVFGEYSLGGSIFLDYRNSREFTDDYSVLYGHHMAAGAMFSDVSKFSQETYFQSHKTGQLLLPGGVTWELQIFAYMDTDGYDQTVYGPVVHSPADQKKLQQYIQKNARIYDRQVQLDENSRMIALTTCTSAMSEERAVLFAKVLYK